MKFNVVQAVVRWIEILDSTLPWSIYIKNGLTMSRGSSLLVPFYSLSPSTNIDWPSHPWSDGRGCGPRRSVCGRPRHWEPRPRPRLYPKHLDDLWIKERWVIVCTGDVVHFFNKRFEIVSTYSKVVYASRFKTYMVTEDIPSVTEESFQGTFRIFTIYDWNKVKFTTPRLKNQTAKQVL